MFFINLIGKILGKYLFWQIKHKPEYLKKFALAAILMNMAILLDEEANLKVLFKFVKENTDKAFEIFDLYFKKGHKRELKKFFKSLL